MKRFCKAVVGQRGVRWGSSLLDGVKTQSGAQGAQGTEAAEETVTMTPGCIERIHKQNSTDATLPFLRLKVVTGGCQGAMYDFDWDDTVRAGDKSFESDGARMLVDENTFETVKGSQIDFKYEMKGNAFQVQRLGDESYQTCSCGSSFSLS